MNKTIIVDFDDTLSFATNRDWDNAVPNIKLIDKLNTLSSSGWAINIYTARGSISCSSRNEADIKYRNHIENWLKLHGVSYDLLSFDKPIGLYYIDDKAITPDDFINLDIKKLENGLSGADIYTDGTYVNKIQSNVYEIEQWYSHVKDILHIPKISSVGGNTIKMEYISNDKNYLKNNLYTALGKIQDTLDIIKKIDIYENYYFKHYIDRIHSHCELANIELFYKIHNELRQHVIKQTFSHGDFGVTNLLFKDKDLYLIDPIPGGFGSIELDAAKFIASLYINNYENDIIDKCFKHLLLYLCIPQKLFTILIASELIRVYKYHPNKELIKKLVKNVYK